MRIAKTSRGNRTRERQLQCPPRCRHSRALDASAAAAAPSPIRGVNSQTPSPSPSATARGKRVGTTRGMRRGMRASVNSPRGMRASSSLAVDRSEPRELPRAWRRPKGCDVQVSVNSHLDVHVSDRRPSCQMMRRAPGLGCCPARAPWWPGGPRRRGLHCCPWRR